MSYPEEAWTKKNLRAQLEMLIHVANSCNADLTLLEFGGKTIFELLTHDQIYVLGMWALCAHQIALMQRLLELDCPLLMEKISSHYYYRGFNVPMHHLLPQQQWQRQGWLWEEMKEYTYPGLDALWSEVEMQKLTTFI